ncbi:ABC transporter ATP-binding protein, partial [Candidatus Saccharibacteria bacterium]|nr:ABC transporter ATP-binding protein [Candidatus Saccharibacteria bacterium]
MMRMRRRNSTASKEERDNLPDVPVQWRRMIGYLRPYIPRLALALGATIISAVLSLVFPQVIGQVLDSVLKEADISLLNNITIALLVVFFIRSIASLIETYNLNYVGERIVVDMRLDLYQHLQNLSLGFFTNHRVGELVSRISSDVTVMRSVLTSNINTLLQQTFIMIGSIIAMFISNWRLTLFIVGLIPVIALVGFTLGLYMRRIST